MNAVVFLDGEGSAHNECRCIKVRPKTSVSQIIQKMVKVQRDWENIGKKAAKMDEGTASTTDAPEDSYGLVLVTDSGDGRPPTEEVLPPELTVDSPRFAQIRRSWGQIILRQMSARCARANAGRSKYSPAPDEDYWFRMNARGAGGQEVRVKLVDLDRYTVAKKKAGWLTVKDKKGKKARWVVLHENTLRWFEEADEKSQPAGIMDDVDAAKMTVKASKKGDSFSIELKGGKVKVVLMCENDVMWERWQEALQRGRSGAAKAQSGQGFQLKLDVELIPEFTEEEERELEARNRVPAVGSLLTTDHLMTGDDYLSIEAVARRAQDGGYLTTGDVSAALINPSDGTYLDLEGLSTMATKAGYIEAAADTYIAVGQLPWDSASVDGGYLDLNTMKKLVSGSGEAYLTIEEAQNVAKVGPVSQPDDLYLTVADACWWMAQNSGVKPATLPPTSRVRSAAEVAAASMRGKVWLSPNGQVLSGKESIQLCHENGYLTVAEMSDLAQQQ
eukprot:m.52366 g.52366  ORF g.52366 m.52366 type:complete len:502 (-) comp9097_c1_seq1:653-2158(-)